MYYFERKKLFMSYQEQLKLAIINEDFYDTNAILERIYNNDEGEV